MNSKEVERANLRSAVHSLRMLRSRGPTQTPSTYTILYIGACMCIYARRGGCASSQKPEIEVADDLDTGDISCTCACQWKFAKPKYVNWLD